MARARDILERHGLVLLEGRPGCGRTTAARVLLHECGGLPRTEVVENDGNIKDQEKPKQDQQELWAQADEIDANDRIVLDLSAVTGQHWEWAQQELSALRERLREQDAKLVGILPGVGQGGLLDEFRHLVVLLGRPAPERVLMRHLRFQQVNLALHGGPPSSLRTSVQRQTSLSAVANLAGLIVRAHQSGLRDVDEWCAAALRAAEPRHEDVQRQLAGLQGGSQRALLLTVAMLHGARLDDIQYATEGLLTLVEHPPEEAPVLDRHSWHSRISAIEAGISPDGRVRFRDPNHDLAVRGYLSVYVPEVHRILPTWFQQVHRLPGLDADGRGDLATRLADQFLGEGTRTGPGTLGTLITTLTERLNTVSASAARRILERGLTNDVHGGWFRQRIYEWSAGKNTSEGLAAVLVSVCDDVMSVDHPHQAVVRLRHLARRPDASRAAREALQRRVREDDRLPVYLLGRLADGFQRGQPGSDYWRTDLELFLDLVDPMVFITPGRGGTLLGKRSVRDRLVRCWAVAFPDRTLAKETIARVHTWLTAAGDDPEHRELLMEVLIAGCMSQAILLGRLLQICSVWRRAARPDDGRRRSDVDDAMAARAFRILAA